MIIVKQKRKKNYVQIRCLNKKNYQVVRKTLILLRIDFAEYANKERTRDEESAEMGAVMDADGGIKSISKREIKS